MIFNPAPDPQCHRMAGRRDGKTDIGALAAGQSPALIHEVKPAGGIMTEATRVLERLSGS